MNTLHTPDICAQVDRLKTLCDRLEDAQSDPARYRSIVAQIRSEAVGIYELVCVEEREEEGKSRGGR